jgi:hypothetical protein
MAYTYKFNFNSTDDVTKSYSIVSPASANYGIKVDDPDLCQLTNLTNPLDKREDLTIRGRDVANVYANTKIDRTLWAPSTRGREVNFNLFNVITHYDSSDASLPQYDSPLKSSITLQGSNLTPVAAFTANLVRLAGIILEWDATTLADGENLLTKVLRGAMNPTR